MSSSTGSNPTTSRSVPHSSHETSSPLSVSVSTWTSASHSGHVPIGTSLPSARIFCQRNVANIFGRLYLHIYDCPNNLTSLAAFCNTLFHYLRSRKTSNMKKPASPTREVYLRFELFSRNSELWISTAAYSVASAAAGRVNMAPD